MVAMSLGLWSSAWAQDKDKDPGQDKDDVRIVVETLEEYEKLLAELDSPEVPRCNVCQFAPGTSEIWMDPLGEVEPEAGGILLTTTENPNWPWGRVTELWLMNDPYAVLTSTIEVNHASSPVFPSAATGGWKLSYVFTYQPPPPSDRILVLPTEIPPFVTDVHEFVIYTVIDGVETESGALYRDREQPYADQEPLWRDVWVLWSNYKFPTAANRATTRIERSEVPLRPLRTFLRSQPANQHLFVRASSTVTPL